MKACEKVVKYVSVQLIRLNDCLDGKNVEALLMEFGIRFHRIVFEHLQQFQYNSMGKKHIWYYNLASTHVTLPVFYLAISNMA